MSTDAASLQELLNSAKTPEDLQAVDELLAELERDRGADDETKPKTRKQWLVETLADVAEFFGIATQTVKQWRTERPQMPGVPGEYPLSEIAKWRFDKLTRSDAKERKNKADADLAETKAEAERLALEKEKRLLVPIADVEQWAAKAIIKFRELTMSLPDKIGNAAPVEIREFARSETDRICREALEGLRRGLELDELEVESDEPDQST